jgi:hypothetical protein
MACMRTYEVGAQLLLVGVKTELLLCLRKLDMPMTCSEFSLARSLSYNRPWTSRGGPRRQVGVGGNVASWPVYPQERDKGLDGPQCWSSLFRKISPPPPHRDRFADRPARSELLYWLRYSTGGGHHLTPSSPRFYPPPPPPCASQSRESNFGVSSSLSLASLS